MIPLLKQNYIKASGQGDTFKIEIDTIRRGGNLYQESVLAAEEIYSLKEGKLHVMYSGGLDSEYVLSVFRHLGMDITPVIMRLIPNYNNFDTEYAFNFCRQYNIEPLVIDVDFKWLVTSGTHFAIAKVLKSDVYHYSATAYAMSKVDGSVLLGEGQMQIDLDPLTQNWNYQFDERDYVFVNFMDRFGIDGTPFFNRWRPEMFAAIMDDPYMENLGNNRIPEHTTSDDGKIEVYNRHSPFKMEPRKKYTGYEIIERTQEIIENPWWGEMKHFGKQHRGYVGIEYNEFVKKYIK